MYNINPSFSVALHSADHPFTASAILIQIALLPLAEIFNASVVWYLVYLVYIFVTCQVFLINQTH